MAAAAVAQGLLWSSGSAAQRGQRRQHRGGGLGGARGIERGVDVQARAGGALGVAARRAVARAHALAHHPQAIVDHLAEDPARGVVAIAIGGGGEADVQADLGLVGLAGADPAGAGRWARARQGGARRRGVLADRPEQVDVVERLLTQAGFEDVQVAPKEDSKTFMADWAPGTPITDYVVSATIEGRKPTA